MKSKLTLQLKGKGLDWAQKEYDKMIENERCSMKISSPDHHSCQRNDMEWISIKDKLPEQKRVLAIYLSKKNTIYNCKANIWSRDIIYICRTNGKKFIIESYDCELPATHWMPLPQLPNSEE